MAFAEGLSDTGELTGRGNPPSAARSRASDVHRRDPAHAAVPDPALPRRAARGRSSSRVELVALAYVRVHFFKIGFLGSILSVTLAGALIAIVSALLGLTG